MIKKYRERIKATTFFVVSTHADRFIHDTIKGWGRLSPSGKTVLWETFRKGKKPKRPVGRPRKGTLPNWDKITFPVIKNMTPEMVNVDILSVQPMQLPSDSLPVRYKDFRRGEKDS